MSDHFERIVNGYGIIRRPHESDISLRNRLLKDFCAQYTSEIYTGSYLITDIRKDHPEYCEECIDRIRCALKHVR